MATPSMVATLKAATAKMNTADAMIKMGATFTMISNRQSVIEKRATISAAILAFSELIESRMRIYVSSFKTGI